MLSQLCLDGLKFLEVAGGEGLAPRIEHLEHLSVVVGKLDAGDVNLGSVLEDWVLAGQLLDHLPLNVRLKTFLLGLVFLFIVFRLLVDPLLPNHGRYIDLHREVSYCGCRQVPASKLHFSFLLCEVNTEEKDRAG